MNEFGVDVSYGTYSVLSSAGLSWQSSSRQVDSSRNDLGLFEDSLVHFNLCAGDAILRGARAGISREPVIGFYLEPSCGFTKHCFI